jgi:glycosyltransferase involved in cell wall biosynthesis
MRPRVGFLLEQTLGHVTHSDNLRRLVPADGRIEAVFGPIEFGVAGPAARLPGYRNWTVRAGIRARRALREMRRGGAVDALFVHTQVPAVLAVDRLRRIPTVVSLDATPLQYDELGGPYGHGRSGRRSEQLKWRLNRACFEHAAAIVTWTAWAKRGLVDGYGVDADKVTVIPPGVDVDRWSTEADRRPATASDRPLRVLFVGADFERKGGSDLLAAVDRLRQRSVPIELDVVTRADPPASPGVRVHRGLGPNSPQLVALYRDSDVFCLPTYADMLPMVLSEAAILGLPIVATGVGAIDEVVKDQRTGLLVPPGDVDALADALARLAADRDLVRQLGDSGREFATTDLDASVNAGRVVDLLLSVSR